MKKFKKILSALIAVSLTLSAFGCKEKKQKEKISTEADPYTAVQLSDVYYQRSKSEITDGLNMLFSCEKYKDGFFLLGSSETKTPAFYLTDEKLENVKELEIPDFSIGASYCVDVSYDGFIYTLVNEDDYGDLPAPDIYAEDYDAELYESVVEYSLMLYKYDTQGNLVSSTDLEELYSLTSGGKVEVTYLHSSADGQNFICNIDGAEYSFSADGTVYGEFKENDEQLFTGYGKNADGTLICAVTDSDRKMVNFCEVDFENCSVKESEITYNVGETVHRIFEGSGNYSHYFVTNNSIIGVNKKDNSLKTLFSVKTSGKASHEILYTLFDENEKCTLVISDYSTYKVEKITYTPRTKEEVENIPVLTIGAPYSVSSYSYIGQLIEQINDEFGDYRIEVKEYGEYSTQENPEGNFDEINQNFIEGTAPDVFILDEYSPIENMGAFEDLYNFIDNDPELNRDAFIPKILEYAENDGKLYSLPLEFAIVTNVGKTKYVGEKESWTYAEYIDTVTRLKDTVPYLSEDMMNPNIITRASPLYQFDYFKSFFDFESGTCNFDNPEFIDILEYCYNFSDNADPPEFVYEEPSIEEMNAEFEMRNMSYRNDQALLHNCYFLSFQSYLETTAGYFDNEEITFVGYPSNDGTGTQIRFYESLRINAASKNKELAWKFIKRLMDYTYTENNITFGITKESLKNAAELAKQPLVRDNTDYTGEYFHTGNKWIEIGNVTDKEIEGVYHLLDIAKKEKNIPYDYIEIIYEEADKYFHDKCTAKQAAEMIQNRLSIFIAEQQ